MRSSLKNWSVGLCLVVAGVVPAWGQCADELKLTASDPAVGDSFGNKVSIDGDTAVVGAYAADLADPTRPDAGSAYVYVLSDGVWTWQAKLVANDAATSDFFGISVSVDGDTAIVGAYGDGSFTGSAYVFVRTGTVWTQQQKLTASDPAVNDEFGLSVAVSGDTIVVGARRNDDAGTDSGSAYVFRFDPLQTTCGQWWCEEQKLLASDGAAVDIFGFSVSVSGDTALIGAHGANYNDGQGHGGTDAGSAYVFTRSGVMWSQQQKLGAEDDAEPTEFFGYSVSVNGDTAVIGAVGDDGACPPIINDCNSGSAFVFVRSGGVWTKQQPKLTASDMQLGDNFGISVSVNGDTTVIGAHQDDLLDPARSDAGSAYVFVRSGGVWPQTETQKLTASDAAASDFFGVFVSVSGDTVVVGASGNDEAGANSGSVYVFECIQSCSPPDCNNHGTCDNGACLCDTGFVGAACDQCAPDYYNYPTCAFCLASTTCSGNGTCNSMGACNCNVGFSGPTCACGDGAVEPGEECDDGVDNSDSQPDACRTNCTAPACGDGVIDTSEECDGVNDAACPGQCRADCTCPPPLANDIVWDPTLNPIPWPNNDPLATSRSLRFTVVGEPGPSKLEAIKVTMVDLQHPRPANLPAQAPPNYTTFDTRVNGTCNAGTLVGHHCDIDADCPPGVVVGRCSPLVACTADPACANPAACTLPSNGCARWVGKLGTFYESQGPPVSGPYTAARLQCTPYYWDWKPEGLITVVGADVAPSSEYSVQVYGASCMGVEAGCLAVSPAVTMYTRRSGDVEQPYNPPSATSQPDVSDVSQLVNKFKKLPGAPVKAISQIQPNLPELNADINVLDILAVVDALKGVKYAFSGPCACPSLVTCEFTACSSDTPCINAYGAGSKCMKTCTGPGPLAGDLCIDSTHCLGSGTCGTGFCRDRCGRCSP